MARRIESTLKKWPNIQKYFGPLIHERLKLRFAAGGDTDSIAWITESDADPAPLEHLLERTCDTPSFDSIFEKLGNDPDPDEKIYDALAVIQTIDLLRNRNYKNVEVVPRRRKRKTVDLTARYHNENWAIEVKHIRGVDIKGLKVKDLKSKIDEALKQIDAFYLDNSCSSYKRAVIITSRRADFWVPIEIDKSDKRIKSVLRRLFESYYLGRLDQIMLVVGLWKPEIIEYP